MVIHDLLSRSGPMTAKEIVIATGQNMRTVQQMIQYLVKARKVERVGSRKISPFVDGYGNCARSIAVYGISEYQPIQHQPIPQDGRSKLTTAGSTERLRSFIDRRKRAWAEDTVRRGACFPMSEVEP